MKTIKIFLLGLIEFRSDVTTNFEGIELSVYDTGRDFGHKITLRFFEGELK